MSAPTTISVDGLQLFTNAELEAALEARDNRTTLDGMRQFLRALGLKHPRVVEYEAREREREAAKQGWTAWYGEHTLCDRDDTAESWTDKAFPTLPDPRVPVVPKGRVVELSGGRTATSFINGDWWLRIDGDGISPRHFPCEMWRDGIHDYAATPADARLLADLVEHPEATDG